LTLSPLCCCLSLGQSCSCHSRRSVCRFISVPKDMGQFNCGAYVAGIVKVRMARTVPPTPTPTPRLSAKYGDHECRQAVDDVYLHRTAVIFTACKFLLTSAASPVMVVNRCLGYGQLLDVCASQSEATWPICPNNPLSFVQDDREACYMALPPSICFTLICSKLVRKPLPEDHLVPSLMVGTCSEAYGPCVQGILDSAGFPARVTAHFVPIEGQLRPRTTILIKFSQEVSGRSYNSAAWNLVD
jgi:hypothetical protein